MRRSPVRPGRAPAAGARPARRTAGVLAAAALTLPLLGAAPPAAPPDAVPSGGTSLQEAFSAAAAAYEVPRSVLLGVSYLQSRWDTHGGAPSVTGGYGPMHLTDARTALAATHHDEGTEDPRGDDARPPLRPEARAPRAGSVPDRLATLPRAAELTGLSAGRLREDPAANVAGGAALLAEAQRELGGEPGGDPADWYGAVARFSGADDIASGAAYADEVYEVIRAGAHRVTDTGEPVVLAARPGLAPDRPALPGTGPRAVSAGSATAPECPATVSCEWIPAPYEEFGDGDYGNHDLADRPASQPVRYIVVHDTEGAWEGVLDMVQDPTYVSWHYSLRSTDGHIAQHVRTKDVAWHAGNWYVNAGSIGLEHEGFLAEPDAWYTEAMYRSSARLVRYLAGKYGIPLDRQHILGHDTVPGPTAAAVPGMHTDPGPYWDWAHYFELLGRPFEATAGKSGGLVTIRPDYATHGPVFTGCGAAAEPCAVHGSSAVRLYSDHDEKSALIRDIGLGSDPTTGVNDLSSRVSTGQQYAVAGRWGDWTAIWYLGRKAWFRNPEERPTAVPAAGRVVTPRKGLDSVPVYGRAYPEEAAYPEGVPVQDVSPLPYTLLKGQRYVTGGKVPGEYLYAVTFDRSSHRVVRGGEPYYRIQFGHRVAFVRAADVTVRTV
ncbi:N-acetylmuramoyl-L-alanine amidase [Streptomyces prasinopilosus]|uniref:N-acetylmuramoyl-L-alanine amidase n=1 Tax=Streptomyces prasinopilosus TaxID=67344 RepID=A0A1G6SIS4_9ACTN|nr:N-acetylmuramoyl-L-alanine amidase [Streptomyces prasinopilosus]